MRLLAAALEQAGLDARIQRTDDLSGGCIHCVMRLTLDDGSAVVAKIAGSDERALLDEEAEGLRALAETRSVLVPAPLTVVEDGGQAVLLMEAISPARATDDAWRRLGEDLAALHAADAGSRYGFHIDNHLGRTFQPNTWCESWVEFNASRRLGHQLELAGDGRLLDRDEAGRVQRVIDRLEGLIPDRPRPALLHGDLWSGNALPGVDSAGQPRIAVIDPAPSIGDGWADIAMMKLFGGFPASCLEAYAQQVDDRESLESRIAVYQLYHVLNHVNLFGRGYAGQAMALAARLGA